MSLRTFMARSRAALHAATTSHARITLVIGNESADLDSATSAILYAYLGSDSKPASSSKSTTAPLVPLLNARAADIPLRPELLALLPHAGLAAADLLTLDDAPADALQPATTRVLLTDCNALTGPLAAPLARSVHGCIDHHADEGGVPPDAAPRVITTAGSCTSLVVAAVRGPWDNAAGAAATAGAAVAQGDAVGEEEGSARRAWDAQAARLALGSVLVDTVCLRDERKTTDVDRDAAAYLEAKIAVGPGGGAFERGAFYGMLTEAKGALDGLSAPDVLRKDYKAWTVGARRLGVACVVKRLAWLRGKTGTDGFAGVLRDFAAARELDVLVVMTACVDEGDAGEFRRELLVWPCKEGSEGIVEMLESRAGGEFGLQEHEHVADGPFKVWWQGNVGASRKQIAPRLRELMEKQAGDGS